MSLGLLQSWIHFQLPFGDHEAEEPDSSPVEFAFFGFGKQAIFQQSLEDETDIGDMFSHGFREDQDVIQVYKDIAIDDVSEDVIQQSLKTYGRVREAVVPPGCVERRLPLISLLDADQVLCVL